MWKGVGTQLQPQHYLLDKLDNVVGVPRGGKFLADSSIFERFNWGSLALVIGQYWKQNWNGG